MIDVQKLSLAFGDRYLFQEISFQLGDRDKICLAGANGSGKTTLLRLLCGENRPDAGAIVRSKSVKIGYLRQHLGEDEGATVYQAALGAFEEALADAKELEALQSALERGEASEEDIHRMDVLQDELVHSGYYTMESETRTILAGLGFGADKQDVPLATLSGGWRMRVALAKVLLSHPTCLFLDEPTNHLDLESIMWLEGYIRNYSGCLVLISHDRQFVDRTCERIVEIQGAGLVYYSVPYAKYEEEKAMRQEQLLREYKKQQDEIAGLERFVERFKAKASKATQAQSKQKALDRIDRIQLPSSVATIRLRFPEAPPSGQWVFETEGLSKRYGDKWVFQDGKFGLKAGDKAVIVGPNGAGKTTLLKLLLGLEKPTAGTIVKGANVQVGYFAQYEEPTAEEADRDLVSTLGGWFPRIPTGTIRAILGSMLFSDDDAFKKFGILSGGERARVRLCRLLLQNCNVLILDEPTNHLDMDSKTLLMRALADFGGTVLFVSHDRHFVASIATRVLMVKDGQVTDYPGDYAYYCHKLASGGPITPPPPINGRAQVAAPHAVPEATKAGGQAEWAARKEAEKKRRKAEKRWSEIEAEVSGLDGKLALVNKELCREEIFSDPAQAADYGKSKRDLEAGLAKLYRELEQLEAEGYGK